MSQLLGAADIRRIAEQLGVTPTKKWGQNFVIDPNTVRRIVQSAQVTADDVVLEVGPGLGSLTLALLETGASALCVEIDERMAMQLPTIVREHMPEASDRLHVVHADAMTITELPMAPTKLVANLPYNVSVPVVLHLLDTFPSLNQGVVMVQQEVADRLSAGPGSKVYGVPSVKARWYAHLESAGSVPRSVFWPVPNVDSGLVRFIRHDPPGDVQLRHRVFALVDAAFGQRRKTIRSAMASALGGTARAEAVIRKAGIDPGSRGEQLPLEKYVAIAHADAEVA